MSVLTFHPLGLYVGVRDLEALGGFLREALGFPVRGRGEDWLDLDNGSIHLRLVQRPEDTPFALEVATKDIPSTLSALGARPEVELVEAEAWATPERREARLRYAGFVDLVVCRTYDEDELGIQPDLPTQLEWDDDARALLIAVLARVPVVFRVVARQKSTARAEELSLEDGEVRVGRFTAIRGLVLVTPIFQHRSLWQALSELGEDPQRWVPELVREVMF